MALRTDILATKVKNRGSIPDNEKRFQASGLIDFATEELKETVFPFLLRFNSNFFLTQTEVQCGDYPSGIIPIPPRAYARSLYEVKYKDTSGNLYNIPRIDLGDEDLYPSVAQSNFAGGNPLGFSPYNDSLKFFTRFTPNSGSIVFTYVVAPSTLVLPDINGNLPAAPIASWIQSDSTLTITADTSMVSADFNINPGTYKYDILRVSTGATVATDVIATLASPGGSATFTTTSINEEVLNGLQDAYETQLYIVPAKVTCWSPIPEEADNLLILATVGRVVEALGYDEDLQKIRIEMKDLIKNLADIYAERVQDEPSKIVARRGIGASIFYNARRYRII